MQLQQLLLANKKQQELLDANKAQIDKLIELQIESNKSSAARETAAQTAFATQQDQNKELSKQVGELLTGMNAQTTAYQSQTNIQI